MKVYLIMELIDGGYECGEYRSVHLVVGDKELAEKIAESLPICTDTSTIGFMVHEWEVVE